MVLDLGTVLVCVQVFVLMLKSRAVMLSARSVTAGVFSRL